MIPAQLIARIRKLEIHTTRLVESRLAGRYHSVFKGSGMAFAEVRPYLPGDDVRVIDWNVSARMNQPHVKLFDEERDRTVVLIVDMSASGAFGSGPVDKREVAAEIAALLAFSAIHNGDRVGLVIATDAVEKFVPAKRGKRHVLRVIREILTYRPRSPRTDLAAALGFVGKVTRRRAVVFVLSDFIATGWRRALRAAARRHDVVPVVVTDPLEDTLPPLGLVVFEDLETGQLVEFDASGPEARAYADRVAAARARRQDTLRRLEIDHVDVRTDRPYIDALVRFFRAREKRMQHL